MKGDLLIFLGILALMILYPMMCWSHRNAGAALMATLFAPLVVVPVGALIYLVIGSVLNGFNVFLEYGDIAMSHGTISYVSGTIAGIAALLGLAHHIRDQRHLSTVKTGPRWGGARPPAKAVLNQRTRLK